MNNSMLDLLQMFRNGNPQQVAMNLLQKQGGNNPLVQNVLQMVQQGNTSGLEQVARNLCKECGVDPDQLMNDIKTNFQ